MTHLIHVAVLAPIDSLLTYACDDDFFKSLIPGDRLIVPLGKKKLLGVYIEEAPSNSGQNYKLKNVEEKIAGPHLFSSPLLKLMEWTSSYYVAPIGEVFKLALPGDLGKTKTSKRKQNKDLLGHYRESPLKDLKLSEAQNKIFQKIILNKFSVDLIHGVTGSGKTEIYLKLIQSILDQGSQALCLVPEISLTPQTLARFQNVLGLNVAAYHSQLSPKQKEMIWLGVNNKSIQVLLGTRSALFAPFADLKLIIIDEEHDLSYKQDERVRYHARDLAIMRAKLEGIPIVLGSATPSIESYYKAKLQKKYHYHVLDNRYGRASLPKLKLLNLAELKNTSFIIHPQLQKVLIKNLELGQQSILFLNRRGFAHFIQCADCQWIAKCPNCEISLSFHKKSKLLKCHYCEEQQVPPLHCPSCHSLEIKSVGMGVEKIEEEIIKQIPNARVARLDRDSIQKKGSLEKILQKFREEEIDILIGTQIISKGHDFPKVTCVGIINADLSLYFPDFRANETSYQLLTQTLGRSGRGEEAGEVYLQTSQLKHPVLETLLSQNADLFYQQEIQNRQELNYPPFSRIILIRAQGTQQNKVEQAIQKIHQTLLSHSQNTYSQILGPAPCLIEKLRNRYRWQIIVKCSSPSSFILAFKDNILSYASGVNIQIDVDAYETV